MKSYFFIFLLVISAICHAQLSPKVQNLVKKLELSERAESRAVSVDGRESKIWKLYDSIRKIATAKEVEHLAFNGNNISKYYFSGILVSKNSQKLPSLYKSYFKSNDSVQVRMGCVGTTFNLANNLYQSVYNIPKSIEEANEMREILSKDSSFVSKEEYDHLTFINPNWTKEKSKNLISTFNKIAFDDKNCPKNIIEYICLINEFNQQKIENYQELVYFQKKYNSAIIKKYMDFCAGNMTEKI